MSYAMHAVSMLLQEGFVDLLKKLPDDYFKLEESKRNAVWQSILSELNHGEKDLDKLASLATVWL
jgi:hypothetical protein